MVKRWGPESTLRPQVRPKKTTNVADTWYVRKMKIQTVDYKHPMQPRSTRRIFLTRSVAAGFWGSSGFGILPTAIGAADDLSDDAVGWLRRIKDADIRAGVEAAIQNNILPAATQTAYPGHFLITADGVPYGIDTTWPGLDSWQMAGAYLLLGRTRLVLDYFDYVRASQRKDGNIPFAVFPEMRANNACLRGLKWPDDVFSYTPPQRDGLPTSSQQTRKWIGLFQHWQNMGDPLTTLGPVCYILTAAEIFDTKPPQNWLLERMASIEKAARHLLSRKSKNGLISGSGFYTEQPPRYKWDGLTQCFVIYALRELARISSAAGYNARSDWWPNEAASDLTNSFIAEFWRGDHFGEYIHPDHGLVDSHGLSDVNWAAVAFGVATDEQLKTLWPRLVEAKEFWWADMPTQAVTKPFAYADWELNFWAPCPAPPLNDVAAMGRVWYLEAMACKRMKAHDRLVESVRKVCRAAMDGFWRERYHPQNDGTVKAYGAAKYCEYPAVLVRLVLGMPEVFCV